MDSLAASRNQLESLLNDIATTRSTLPSLLRAFQTPQLSSQELALLYSNRSKIASNSLKSLRDSLGAAEGVLERARVSEEKDSSGIVLGKERERRGDVMGLNELRIIFRVKSEEKVRKSSGKPPTRISNLQEMNEVLCGWEEIYPRVRIEPVVDQRAVKLVVRGLMKVSLHLYWDEEEMQVERIICCGLKENIPNYSRSEYTLFREITQGGMKLVAASAVRRSKAEERKEEGGGVSNLVEILEYLSDPPLPF